MFDVSSFFKSGLSTFGIVEPQVIFVLRNLNLKRVLFVFPWSNSSEVRMKILKPYERVLFFCDVSNSREVS